MRLSNTKATPHLVAVSPAQEGFCLCELLSSYLFVKSKGLFHCLTLWNIKALLIFIWTLCSEELALTRHVSLPCTDGQAFYRAVQKDDSIVIN